MSKRISLSLLTIPFVLAFSTPTYGQSRAGTLLHGASSLYLSSRLVSGSSEREQDGLNGPVRRVRTETAKLASKNGQLIEGQRVTLEVAAYDVKGAKIENAYYPVPGASITGKEVYKYDEKGNIIEMTLQDEKGTLLSKETYTYEFDQFGNWIKMTASVAVIENGRITFEPTEVTYRTISYYLDEATLARMSQPASPAASNTNNAPAGAASTSPASTSAAKTPDNIASKTATGMQPSSGLKPAAQTAAAPTDSFSTSKQSSQPVASNNKPVVAPASDASTQAATQSKQTLAQANAPIVKTSAPVSDKPAAASNEKAQNAGQAVKPAETKPVVEQPAKAAIKPLLKPVTGGVLNGKALSLPKPSYSAAARSSRASGTVVVEVVIDVNGKVISARALSGPVLLQQAAVQAAYQAKFSPTMLADQPVKVVGTINYNFMASQ